ncbi:MAG: methylenetetrahydrofolate reductase [NAD(P)H] [Propionibacteriaceae bacterium]|nr:methylenetetrahydrofolate reductase [NAD(P)H] [Propionibacteriaceae bacterium]
MSEPTIAERLRAGRTSSFEFFPPKTAEGERQLRQAIGELEALAPDFISVTYGATGSTRERTIAATRYIAEETSVATMGHLTCVGQRVDELEGALDAYRQAGVKHILALRGDPVGGPGAPWRTHPGGLSNATQLVRLVKASGDFCVGVAAFPDGHPDQFDFDLDARILADKEQAGAEFAVTQLFFRPERYAELVARVRRLGCRLPIIPGIMPVTSVAQVERFATLSGADMPAELAARLEAVADDDEAVGQVGEDIAVELCVRLLDDGAPGLHFFTQNRSRATARILARLRAGPSRA